MVSTTENTFGAKLRRSQDLLTYISGFTSYNPPRTQENVAGMTALINSIVSTNATEAAQRGNYKISTDKRQIAFSKAPGSVEKLLAPIKGAIEAQYGKKSSESEIISAIINKMRTTKITKSPADPTKEKKETTVSQSERSYGSITQMFNDIVNSLTQFTSYNPSNPQLKITNLQATLSQITSLNNEVAKSTQQLKTTQSSRLKQYADLKDRVQRIKSYVKAQYGTSSNEFNLIKGISV